MKDISKRKMARLPAGGESPLSAALHKRDRSVIEMASDAIRHKQALLAFQPVMQARAPHQIAFYEGLIRVLDETGRVIPAGSFVGALEDSELGRQLDCNALEIGLRTLSRNPGIRLSINMSARSVGYRQWMQILDRHLNRDKTLGERLILEISEPSAATVPELVIDFMDRLQDRGIGFALDDFGSGPLALRHFRNFFFDAVKIDGQFVRGLHTNPDNQTLVRALISVAQTFDMFTIAESVESARDAAFLRTLGIDCMQGYHFGAPTVRPPWLAQRSAASA